MDTLVLTAWQRRGLQRQLQQTRDAHVFRRTLAVLEFSRGRPIVAIARTLGVSRQSVYTWVEQYAGPCDPAALYDAPRPGRPSLWADAAQAALLALLAGTPQQLGLAAVNWTVPLLQGQLEQRRGPRFSADTIRRELRRQGYVWKRPRYVLAPDPQREKKTADTPAGPGAAVAQRPAG